MADEQITQKLLEHDDRFDKTDSKIDEFRGEFLQGQDEIMTILKRLDQERIFTAEWIKRIENDIEQQKEEIEAQKQKIQKNTESIERVKNELAV